MRKVILSVSMFILAFSSAIYADNFFENNLLIQLHNFQDLSTLTTQEETYSLNSDQVNVPGNVATYCYYTCDECGTSYQYEPSECKVCGNTSFTSHDQLPDIG